jgi:hypothetical protein
MRWRMLPWHSQALLTNVPQLHHAYFTVLESYESCGGTPGPSGA